MFGFGATATLCIEFSPSGSWQKGQNLVVIATSLDGKVVEGLQHKIFKEVVGVQFHPERATLYTYREVGLPTPPDNDYSPNEQLITERRAWSFI